jgi:hypothetical protein
MADDSGVGVDRSADFALSSTLGALTDEGSGVSVVCSADSTFLSALETFAGDDAGVLIACFTGSTLFSMLGTLAGLSRARVIQKSIPTIASTVKTATPPRNRNGPVLFFLRGANIFVGSSCPIS